MDVERTMEFILEQQAKAEASHARGEAALARTDETLARLAARQNSTEAILRRAIRAGVSEARNQRVQTKQLREEMEKLAAAQRKTEVSLNAFIESMRGGNGRH